MTQRARPDSDSRGEQLKFSILPFGRNPIRPAKIIIVKGPGQKQPLVRAQSIRPITRSTNDFGTISARRRTRRISFPIHWTRTIFVSNRTSVALGIKVVTRPRGRVTKQSMGMLRCGQSAGRKSNRKSKLRRCSRPDDEPNQRPRGTS
jgi:hypothetical protein